MKTKYLYTKVSVEQVTPGYWKVSEATTGYIYKNVGSYDEAIAYCTKNGFTVVKVHSLLDDDE